MSEISYEMPTRKGFQNLSGQVFGRLTVLEWNHKKGDSYYLCRCDCGNNTVIQGGHLKNGHIKSCGCYKKERDIERATKHDLYNHPIYGRCKMILERCYNENHISFNNYGGRKESSGIYVQESWKNNLALMIREIEAEIGLPPTKTHQIDRKKNHLGYETGNIQWVTPEENTRNRRNTHNHGKDPLTRKPTPTYNSWQNLLKNHGDEVCTEWMPDGNCETSNGFKQFLDDMGIKPRKRSPIKRHDESLPFCKDNCFWG